ncbi:archaetidylserine decarboxylase [Dyella nitratireducens]|uniref:Phosphatidylserine decarboxylase proenzyme n=1 Tax=Dyella nitratireducens TaxID=1849580 RepID=A0ABQ1GXB8_9GAMM|nr:archaetidylserine decarboxylase [Dyella nitratireducens]GGA52238.1 phosphatidylserine decarboxylase proenzyme [Dyella nitratireducens]GLQ41598.1 phosphatidylserine decarboxylase proenzyme [Dyella nitratireducens]
MTFKVFLQYILPHRALSRVVYWATRWTFAPWKNFLIGKIVRSYQVDMTEAAQSDPFAYPHFNAFFTRKLRPDARRADAAPGALISPADGRISQAGPIDGGRIFQAKGQQYTAAELLGDEAAAAPYRNGRFVTIYLSPRDYHRVHMPLRGKLKETVHIPGRIFSVAPFAVDAIPRLFARNERLVCHFEGAHGPFAVIMVGAILVSSVATVWDGLVIPPYAPSIRRKSFEGQNIELARFAEMARFNMGSTVIVLLPEGAGELDTLASQQVIKVGQRLGDMHHI